MSTIRVNAIQNTNANSGNMLLHANGNVSMTTSNTTLFIGNTAISNAGISVGGAAINPLATGMRNRIINGDFRIDQRFNGTANTVMSGNTYVPDRWMGAFSGSLSGKFSIQSQTTGGPTGIPTYARVAVVSAYTPVSNDNLTFRQIVEGYNVADLAWGTADAKTVTLSFWVRSSLTGTFGGSLLLNGTIATYPYTYSISSANTWEYKTIVIPGSVTGSPQSITNVYGVYVHFSLGGAGTILGTPGSWDTGASLRYGATGQVNMIASAGATWDVTGVQFEAGTVATPFEFRHYGQELALCQRYYQPLNTGGSVLLMNYLDGTSIYNTNVWYKVTMRAIPTISTSSFTYRVGSSYTNGSVSSVTGTSNYADIRLSCPSAPNTAGTAGHCILDSGWATSAEL